jgi:hypothetical protein
MAQVSYVLEISDDPTGEALTLNAGAHSALSIKSGDALLEALEHGIRWPSPAESPPFWERPARDAPLPLGATRAFLRPVLRPPEGAKLKKPL